ncbi:MAG: hypothetical protein IPN79_10255 [Saprospiraceae bacterium]|nr:hypothetical protein [Saprospiraceae bacterium]
MKNRLIFVFPKRVGGPMLGVMDSYFPSAAFFTEFERFDRHLEKLKRSEGGLGHSFWPGMELMSRETHGINRPFTRDGKKVKFT